MRIPEKIAEHAVEAFESDPRLTVNENADLYMVGYPALKDLIVSAIEADREQRLTLPEGIEEIGAYDYSNDEPGYEDRGYKVVQIDTDNPGRIRVYVNDGVIYDGNPEVTA